jgi:hypothetical protein
MLGLCGQASAQEKGGVAGFLKKVGTLIDSMTVRGIDRNYIDAPKEPWQIIVRGNLNQSTMELESKGTVLGTDYSITPYMKTEPSQYVGLWAGYRGYGFGYTVNVGGDRGIHLTFGATGSSYGVNVRINTFRNDEPEIDISSSPAPEEEDIGSPYMHLTDPIKVRTVIANAYYLFNGKRFSYCAAYDQSVFQKRSAGSLLAGAMYYYGRINYASDANAPLIYLMHGLGRVKTWQGSVGAGYAYNWVPARGLLVSAMAMPMLTFVNKLKAYGYSSNLLQLLADPYTDNLEISDEEWNEWLYNNLRITSAGDKYFNSGMTLNFDARLSLTYNFGRYFVNIFGQFNNMRYHHENSRGNMNDWYVNTSIGLRL